MLHKPALYSIVIWLTAVICAPILFALTMMIYNKDGADTGFFIVPYAWIFGGILSIPSFILLLILNFQLAKRNLMNRTHVAILLISCTVLAFLAFLFFSNRFGEFSFSEIDGEFIVLIGSYLICLYIAILFGLFSPRKVILNSLDASEMSVETDS